MSDHSPVMTDDEIVQTFLKEASRYPLLTKQEEQELGRRICDGDRDAFNDLVQRNLRLVAKVSMQTPTSAGLSRADMIQEGTFGLMRAAEKFDWRKGFKFSTYAVWWIRQSIARAVPSHGRVIRMPQHTFDELIQLRKTRDDLERELGRPASYQAVADRMGVTIEKIAFLDDVGRDAVSIQQPVNTDGLTLEDVIPTVEVEDVALELSDELERALATLTPREREAVMRRHGLDGSNLRTWQELGDELGIKKASARGLEIRAIRKLRAALDG